MTENTTIAQWSKRVQIHNIKALQAVACSSVIETRFNRVKTPIDHFFGEYDEQKNQRLGPHLFLCTQ